MKVLLANPETSRSFYEFFPYREGYIRRLASAHYDDYVAKSDIITGVREFAHVVKELTRRLIFEQKRLDYTEW